MQLLFPPHVAAFPSRFIISLSLPHSSINPPSHFRLRLKLLSDYSYSFISPIQREKRGEMELSGNKNGCSSPPSGKSKGGDKKDLFHVIHKVPSGDSPYVRAKHLQLVEKDPDRAIVWFWKAINAGDRADSALKDMAVVMKQQDRAQEAIEAIKSFRHLCCKNAQESLDNLLIDLYKKCGMVEEQIELLKQKLRMIYLGEAFNGKTTKAARSHGKKFQVSIKQETARILGNLGWAYMQQNNYNAAEMVYQKAQSVEPDSNKACNLGLCLMKQGKFEESRQILLNVFLRKYPGSDDPKTVKRAEELWSEIELVRVTDTELELRFEFEDEFMERIDLVLNEWAPFKSKRLPIFEEISTLRDQIAC